jgi:hypothetical protein
MKRLLAMVAVSASALACGVLVTIAQSAAAVSAVTANGTLSCSAAKGTITFSPPLTENGTSSGRLKYFPRQCTTTATNLPSTELIIGQDYIDLRGSSASNPGFGRIFNYWGGSLPAAVAATKISVPGSQFVTTASGDVGIAMQGTAKGSFAGPTQVTLNSTTSISAFQAELQKGGVSKLTFTSGSANIGNG